MANIKSAKKQARQNIKRESVNLARKSSLKTAAKKLLLAIEQGKDTQQIQALLKDAESKFARAKGKGLVHANTASRKISRLAKKAAQAQATK